MKGDIAIIGIAGRFPDARNLEAFYQNLRQGVDSTKPMSTSRRCHSTIDPQAGYKPFSFIEDIDKFDHRFFNISLDEAEKMDPHQRLILEEVYKTLESSGRPISHFWDTKTAVFVADVELNYYNHAESFSPVLFAGNLNPVVAGRISRYFKLRGSAMMVDTACSSSLVALHLACRELNSGDAEMAVVATASIRLFPTKEDSVIDVGVSSSSGRTCSFSADASGSGSGESVVSLLLKRMEDAQRDKDPIYAVVKGSAINQDAHLSGSLTAPSSTAQKEVILQAWQNAEIDPLSITYVEAHGSATRLGDPIEIDGLTQAFRQFTEKKHHCAVSSVKSNIGHTGTSAGLSGLTKAILALQHKELFPSVNFSEPNPFIDFDNAAVYINQELKDWEKPNGTPLRAGVSSFGLSGTNCHVVLEEAPQIRQNGNRIPQSKALLFPVSAKSKLALEQNKSALADHLQRHPNIPLDTLSYNLSSGRDHYPYREAFIAENMSSLIAALQANGEEVHLKKEFHKLVLVFSDELALAAKAIIAFGEHSPTYKKRIDACLQQVTEAERNDQFYHFAFQYAFYPLLAEHGVETENLLGVGIGNEVVEVLSGDMELKDGLTAAIKHQYEAMEDLAGRMQKLVKREVSAPTLFLNIGTDSTITKTLKELKKKKRNSRYEVLTIEDISVITTTTLLQQLYLLGFPIDWKQFYKDQDHSVVPLPSYQFEAIRCWLKPALEESEVAGNGLTDTQPKQTKTAPVAAPAATDIANYNFPDSWTETQQKVAAIWVDLLKLKGELTLTDDFYKLGGQSLYTIQMMNRINADFGVEIAFKNAFEWSTIELLAKHIEELKAENPELYFSQAITPLPPQPHYELSRNQARLWFLNQMEEEQLNYLLSAFNVIHGNFKMEALEKAFETMIRRHESLRTVFIIVDGEPRQKVLDYEETGFKLGYRDLRALSPEEQARVMKEEAQREHRTPIDLENGPLLRAKMLHLSDNKMGFFRSIHHIVSDGWSLDVMTNELITTYSVFADGIKNPFGPLKIQYKDYAAWSNNMMSGKRLEKNKAYWLEKFKGDVPETGFPLDFTRPPRKTWKGDNMLYMLDAKRSLKLEAMGLEKRASLFMVVYAAIKALYYRYTLETDVIFGTVISSRSSHNLEDQLGFYTNTLALRTIFDPEDSFEELLDKMRDTALEAFDHQWYPYDQMVKDLKIKRKENRFPLFNTSVELRNTDTILGDLACWENEEIGTDVGLTLFSEANYPVSKYDLTFRFAKEDKDEISFYIEYNIQLYKRESIQLIVERLFKLIEIVSNDPSIKLKDIPLFDGEKMAPATIPDTDLLFDYTF